MKKPSLLLGTAAFFLALAPAHGQASQEEQTVKKTYAKLAFATMVERVHDLLTKTDDPSVAEIENAIADRGFRFELSNFAVGPVAEIAKQPYCDLVTPPDGQQDVVESIAVTFTHTEDLRKQLEVRETQEFGARVRWVKGQEASRENWKMPFGEALTLFNSNNNSLYSRYISFHVAVSLDGRSRSYKAMFLFGSGQVPVLVLDNVTSNSALGQFVTTSVYPAILLDSGMTQKQGVADWLSLHQVDESACPSGKREVCCDPTTLKCGLARADVAASLRRANSRLYTPRPPSGEKQAPKPRFVNVSTSVFTAYGRPVVHCDTFNYNPPAPPQQRKPHAEDRVLFNPETRAPFTSRVYLSRRAKDFCHRAGVKGSAHCFRDTFACDMLARGNGIYEVAQMLADTVETVQRCYAQFVPAARDAVQAKMDTGVGIEEQARIAAQRGNKVVGIRG